MYSLYLIKNFKLPHYYKSVAFSISHYTEANPIQEASINTALGNFVCIITETADLAIPKIKNTSSNSNSFHRGTNNDLKRSKTVNTSSIDTKNITLKKTLLILKSTEHYHRKSLKKAKSNHGWCRFHSLTHPPQPQKYGKRSGKSKETKHTTQSLP